MAEGGKRRQPSGGKIDPREERSEVRMRPDRIEPWIDPEMQQSRILHLPGVLECFECRLGRTKLSLSGAFWEFLDNLDFSKLGYAVVGMFVATWAFSLIVWKTRRIEARWGSMIDRG